MIFAPFANLLKIGKKAVAKASWLVAALPPPQGCLCWANKTRHVLPEGMPFSHAVTGFLGYQVLVILEKQCIMIRISCLLQS
ncbi:MAG: hypothetical protein M0T74_06175 [Desulfitobacterium hafniense]|nr:hypothetical protein [Desulfitobacterium hafniense]